MSKTKLNIKIMEKYSENPINGKPHECDKNNSEMDDQSFTEVKKVDNNKDVHYRFGYFSFTPSCLQVFNRAVCVLVFLTASNTIASGTYNGLSGAVQSSIETRFQLTSTQSSWIMTSFDVAAIFSSFLFTYIGSNPKCHRPRVITIGLIGTSLACVLYALPHFTTDVYIPSGDAYETDDLCRDRSDEDICENATSSFVFDTHSSLDNYLAVFIIARVLISFGITPITMLGLTYLDDCVSKETFSFYSGKLFLFYYQFNSI